MAFALKLGDQRIDIEPLLVTVPGSPEDRSHHNAVGHGQARSQLALEDVARQGIGTRFEHDPQAASLVSCPQRLERGGNRGRVVGEVVDNGDTRDLGPHLQPPLHAAEALQSLADHGRLDAIARRHRHRRRRVQNVVLAGERKLELGPAAPLAIDGPPGARRLVGNVRNPPVGGLGKAVTLDPAARHPQTVVDVRMSIPGDQQAPARHQFHQQVKAGFDRRQVRVDVAVVELDRRKYRRIWKIVQKLRPLVEERRVVFVALNDELATRAHPEA